MNIFETILLDSILLTFPILVYLIYLTTNNFITQKSKKLYFVLALFTSFFLLYNYSIDNTKLILILILNSIVLLSYLENNIVFSNIFGILIILLFKNNFNNIYFLLIIYVITDIIYILLKKKITDFIFSQIFMLINIIIYILWIIIFNNSYNFNVIIQSIICYYFIINIYSLIYETSKNILQKHLTIKELYKEKQIRLSLFKITHEIKNPIAVCKGYLDMINTKDTKQVERYIPIIKSEIDRLLLLLQDFLLINKNNLDIDIMDINLLIEESINKLNPLLEEKNINIKLKLLDDEIYINGDYNRLDQVILNIIKNSIESIKTKGNIEITSKLINKKYVVEIKDNGEGMTKDTLEKMKEPFFTTKYRGSGLGIPLIYEIIEAHGGKVLYESEYGKGTKVKIQLPIYE